MYGLMRGTGLRFTEDSKRARSWKRPIQPRSSLKNDAPVLYSTFSLLLARVPVYLNGAAKRVPLSLDSIGTQQRRFFRLPAKITFIRRVMNGSSLELASCSALVLGLSFCCQCDD